MRTNENDVTQDQICYLRHLCNELEMTEDEALEYCDSAAHKASFADLTRREASIIIQALKAELGD